MGSIYEKLKVTSARDVLRLHTPGHKGELCALDTTELTDGSFPADVLTNAEKKAAIAFGAKHARYLCGGSSQGVKAALFYANTAVVADVNSHRSVYDGMRLVGKKLVTAGERGGIEPLTVERIDKALTPDVGAVIVTSPTYYGYCADIDGIGEYCKRKGLLFIVDGAHGAHFGFCERLPRALGSRCDIYNLSAHKTLFALTQCALLFDNLDGACSRRLSEATEIMGTTSPSYLLYASIEHAAERAATEETRAAYDALFAPICDIKREFPFVANDDFTRLVLDCNAAGADCEKLNAALAARGVFSERADGRYIVFIFTAANAPKDVEELARCLTDCLRK